MRRPLSAALAALLACIAAAPPARAAALYEIYHQSRPAMGTSFDVYLYAAGEAEAAAAFEAAFDEIERVEAALSNYRPSSELSRINRLAAVEAVVTDPEVFGLLGRSLDYSRESGGAFDVTVGPLIRAWGFFRGEGRYPSDEELARARAATGWRRVTLDAAARSVRFAGPVELDLGAIGKGFAIDRVVAVLERGGVRAALVGSGTSSVYALGAPPGKAGWEVRVADPADRSRALATLTLRDRSVSTSGNYEKFFRIGGRTYCHIVDPRTGRPVEGMLQTTVVAPAAAESDALATALFVLGPEAGARLLARRAGAGALFVTDRAGPARVVELRWPGTLAALAAP